MGVDSWTAIVRAFIACNPAMIMHLHTTATACRIRHTPTLIAHRVASQYMVFIRKALVLRSRVHDREEERRVGALTGWKTYKGKVVQEERNRCGVGPTRGGNGA